MDHPLITDGYGLLFNPEAHRHYIASAIQIWQEEQDYINNNPELPKEPIWKEKPAGQYEKGSGI